MNSKYSRNIDRRLRTHCIVEGLHKGQRISRIEAMVLLAIPNLTSIISNLRLPLCRRPHILGKTRGLYGGGCVALGDLLCCIQVF